MLVGMNYVPNQFSRAIETYGCECVHINGDPKGNFPTVDAAILAISHSSHAKFYAAKDYCRTNKIPMFISNSGFTYIKEAFEDWFFKARPKTQMEKAFMEAKAKAPYETNRKLAPRDLSREDWVTQTNSIIIEQANKGMSSRETISELIKAGFVVNYAGLPWKVGALDSKRSKLRNRGKIKSVSELRSNPPKAVSSETLAPASPSTARTNDLMGKVFSSQLSEKRKFQLVEEIYAGLITTETSFLVENHEQTIHLIKRSIFTETDERFVIDRDAAEAIVQNVEQIRALVANL